MYSIGNIVNGIVIAIHNVRAVVDWGKGLSLCEGCKRVLRCFVHLKLILKNG